MPLASYPSVSSRTSSDSTMSLLSSTTRTRVRWGMAKILSTLLNLVRLAGPWDLSAGPLDGAPYRGARHREGSLGLIDFRSLSLSALKGPQCCEIQSRAQISDRTRPAPAEG